MERDPNFRLFHRYNKLVRRDLVKPLTCTTCGSALITGMDADDELILQCFTCGTWKRPGTGTIDTVRAVVTEHFLE